MLIANGFRAIVTGKRRIFTRDLLGLLCYFMCKFET